MRAYKNIALITAVVLVALLVPGGCEAKTPAVFTSTPAGLACIEIMKKVPRYHDAFIFWDVKALRSDPDHAEMYREFYDEFVDNTVEPFGVDSDSIDYLAFVEGVTLIQGDLDLDAIRGSFPAGFTCYTDYEDLELWRGPPRQELQDLSGSLILAEGLFIWRYNRSDLDRFLSVYEGEEPSMYSESAVEVLERLPEALMTWVDCSVGLEGCIIEVMAVAKEEGDTYRWICVYKFESLEYATSADAEEYFQGIEDNFKEAESSYAESGEPGLIHSFTLEKDGEFVEWSVIVGEEYMISLLFYG